MPYKDPERRREAVRRSMKDNRARKGSTVAKLAEQVQEAAGLPEPPTRDFLLRALGVQAMEGNVAAIRLLLEEYRRDGDDDVSGGQDPLADLDELATRRSARA